MDMSADDLIKRLQAVGGKWVRVSIDDSITTTSESACVHIITHHFHVDKDGSYISFQDPDGTLGHPHHLREVSHGCLLPDRPVEWKITHEYWQAE